MDLKDCMASPLGYNPFDFVRSREGSLPNEQDVISIAEALCPIEDTRAPFWDYTGQVLLSSLIYFVLAYLPGDEHTLGHVCKLYDTLIDGRYVQMLDDIRQEEPDSFALRQFAFIDGCKDADKMRASIYGIVGEKLSFFRYDGMDHLAANPRRVSFDRLRWKKTLLILNVSDHDRSQDRLVSLFYRQAFQALIENDSGYPVRIIMDDFAAGCPIQDFDNIISVVRSRNIHVSLIIQSIAQLEAVYHKRAMTIADNCDTTLYLGGNNPETARFIAERANMMPWTVLSMRIDDALLLQRGAAPRKVQRIRLEEETELMRMLQARRDEEDAVTIEVDISDLELPLSGIDYIEEASI